VLERIQVKKGKIESILTGNWKLIDRSTEADILCAICEGVVDKPTENGGH